MELIGITTHMATNGDTMTVEEWQACQRIQRLNESLSRADRRRQTMERDNGPARRGSAAGAGIPGDAGGGRRVDAGRLVH